MDVHVVPLSAHEHQPLFTDTKALGFCKTFTDLMFTMQYTEGKGWHRAEISRRRPLEMEPSSLVFHYAQEIFEGLKAYRSQGNDILLFRPEMNARRFNRSAERLCMPTIPEEFFLESIERLVTLEERWIPRTPDASLYIRPFMIASDETLGIRASTNYLYCVILSPVGPYFQDGFKPISLLVTSDYCRAAKGGLGEAKTGGNYAASLLGGKIAKSKGCSQVLWLDSAERRWIEEVGAMNIFFVYKNRLVTPRLNGSILAGITRDSVLKLAPDLGFCVEERDVALNEVLDGIAGGQVTEVFGCGTAATISPVGSLNYQDEEYVVNQRRVGPVSTELFEALQGIQIGALPDKHGWVRNIGKGSLPETAPNTSGSSNSTSNSSPASTPEKYFFA
jgi:branched-chain amino acid aminotransferase